MILDILYNDGERVWHQVRKVSLYEPNRVLYVYDEKPGYASIKLADIKEATLYGHDGYDLWTYGVG